jgi:hypothetical protein
MWGWPRNSLQFSSIVFLRRFTCRTTSQPHFPSRTACISNCHLWAGLTGFKSAYRWLVDRIESNIYNMPSRHVRLAIPCIPDHYNCFAHIDQVRRPSLEFRGSFALPSCHLWNLWNLSVGWATKIYSRRVLEILIWSKDINLNLRSTWIPLNDYQSNL